MSIINNFIYTPYKKNVRVRRTSVRLSVVVVVVGAFLRRCQSRARFPRPKKGNHVVVVVVVGAFLRRCQSRAGFPGPPKGNFYRE